MYYIILYCFSSRVLIFLDYSSFPFFFFFWSLVSVESFIFFLSFSWWLRQKISWSCFFLCYFSQIVRFDRRGRRRWRRTSAEDGSRTAIVYKWAGNEKQGVKRKPYWCWGRSSQVVNPRKPVLLTTNRCLTGWIWGRGKGM